MHLCTCSSFDVGMCWFKLHVLPPREKKKPAKNRTEEVRLCDSAVALSTIDIIAGVAAILGVVVKKYLRRNLSVCVLSEMNY